MKAFRIPLLAALVTCTLSATTYDVTAGWHDSSNPNGVWQYAAGLSLLPWQSNFATGTCAAGSLGLTGAYALGVNFNGGCIPFFAQATGNAKNADGWLKGDIVMASQDPQNGAGEMNATLIWTAPAAGTITWLGNIWYAQASEHRSNDFTLSLGSTTLAHATIAYNSTVGNARSNPYPFSSSGPLSVNKGDRVTLVITRSAGQPSSSLDGVQLEIRETPALLSTPTIAPGGVVPVYSSSTTIQPGSWVSIYGTNLASATSVWNGNFPVSLGGVSVTVNSKPAYLWFVSPTQINLQAPADTATGAVLVTVTTPAGSASSAVTLGTYGPSFSLLNAKYPAAIVLTSGPGNTGGGYDVIGPAGAFSYPTRPVKAGETLILYGVGFGPTTPAVPAGQAFSGAAPSVTLPVVTIGGVTATVNFGGIVEAGLFQFNVVVPSAGSGDQPLQAMIGGMTTPANVFVTLQ